jgi:electron transport complex protein RnfE
MIIDPMQPQENHELARKVKRDRILLNNPVVMQGLGLAPLVVAAINVKNATMLAVAVALLLTPTRVIAAFLSRFSYFRFRGLTYTVTSAVVYAGVLWVMEHLFTSADITLLGLYLPLLVADPIILKRYERPQRERIRTAFRKGVITTAGYVLAMYVTAIMREFLGTGVLFGFTLTKTPLFPMAQLPSGGFILLALMIALWRGGVNIVKRQMGLGVKRQA